MEQFTGDMAAAFGRSCDWDGEPAGTPEVRVDTSGAVPVVEIAIPLSDDDGDSRIVSAELSLPDLELALAYLKARTAPTRTTEGGETDG